MTSDSIRFGALSNAGAMGATTYSGIPTTAASVANPLPNTVLEPVRLAPPSTSSLQQSGLSGGGDRFTYPLSAPLLGSQLPANQTAWTSTTLPYSPTTQPKPALADGFPSGVVSSGVVPGSDFLPTKPSTASTSANTPPVVNPFLLPSEEIGQTSFPGISFPADAAAASSTPLDPLASVSPSENPFSEASLPQQQRITATANSANLTGPLDPDAARIGQDIGNIFAQFLTQNPAVLESLVQHNIDDRLGRLKQDWRGELNRVRDTIQQNNRFFLAGPGKRAVKPALEKMIPVLPDQHEWVGQALVEYMLGKKDIDFYINQLKPPTPPEGSLNPSSAAASTKVAVAPRSSVDASLEDGRRGVSAAKSSSQNVPQAFPADFPLVVPS
ncbi:MAG: hypothetical protein SFZ03_10640 [Candidatus Melainabacteria bacterium]|nr:hypothetical protein [Candidatus Melainabacteria bacterium]